MNAETCKTLQEIGAFALAGGCSKARIKEVAEMIRVARKYRWVGIYKVNKTEFVSITGTGDQPNAYPRFPIAQGLCGAALELGKTINVGDVRKDGRHLPAFHNTRSEMIVPMINDDKRIVGMLCSDSDELNAFAKEDKEFLERAAGLIAHCLH